MAFIRIMKRRHLYVIPSIHIFSLPLTLSDKYWCWISSHYFAERLAGEYLWLWIALISAILYIPLYFWAEGRLSVDREKWYIFRTSKANVEYARRRAALRLLLLVLPVPVLNPAHRLFSYPLAYSLVVLPLSVARWLQFQHKSVPSAATFFGSSMFGLSGTINVCLFLLVRPQLLLFTPPEEPVEPERQLARPGMNLAMLPVVTYDHSLQQIGIGLEDDFEKNRASEGFRNGATLSHVTVSSARSVDKDI
jgi:hypothetical protein